MAALRAQFPRLERVSDLYFDDENVWLTIVEPNTRNLSRSVLWLRSSDLYIGEEDYVEEAEENSTYPISDVDVDAITALVDGLAVRREKALRQSARDDLVSARTGHCSHR